jgi:hypothetical protein
MTGILNAYRRVDSEVRIFLRSLWVARVSVVSIVFACVLLSLVPQAQDLFIEIKSNIRQTFAHWATFYVVAIVFWIMPVYLSARISLHLDQANAGVRTPGGSKRYVNWLPRLLALACFITISIGIHSAAVNLASNKLIGTADLPRVFRSLLGDSDSPTSSHARNVLFVAFWASVFISAGMAALLLSSNFVNFLLRCSSGAYRVLRAFFTYLFFAQLSRLTVRRNVDHNAPAPGWIYLRLNQCASKLKYLWAVIAGRLNRTIDWLSVPQAQSFTSPHESTLNPPLIAKNGEHALQNKLIFPLMLLIILWLFDVGLVVLFRFHEGGAAEYLSRAVLLPVVLGIFVPSLTALVLLSRRYRHPFTLYCVALLGLWGALAERRYDVHTVAIPSDHVLARFTLPMAIDAWMVANDCQSASVPCPQPILVAASGGASRAAFFTASVLTMLQETSEFATAPHHRTFAQQAFAMSTVSGSALGATFCDDQPNWFGCHDSVSQRTILAARRIFSRSKLLTPRVQAFVADDHLTSTIAALIFGDILHFGGDRASALEESWRRNFQKSFRSDELGRPLSSLATVAIPNSDWRPILIFNGTSVETGRRIITTALAPTVEGKPIFEDSYDFYSMMCEEGPATIATRCRCPRGIAAGLSDHQAQCDISLATAVTMSARFPLISPSGIIRNPDDAVVDRVVDGGYFENFGALTAIELARAVRTTSAKMGKELKPFILQISNDPEAFLGDCERDRHSSPAGLNAKPTQPHGADSLRFFSWLYDPAAAVLNTRTARGYHATIMAEQEVNEMQADSYVHIWVCPQRIEWEGHDVRAEENGYKNVSMSWWLSMPVQEYLDHQITSLPHNMAGMTRLQEVVASGRLMEPSRK